MTDGMGEGEGDEELDEWEPPTLLERLPGEYDEIEAKKQIFYHIGLFALLGVSFGLSFGLLALTQDTSNTTTGAGLEVSVTTIIISGYMMAIYLSPFLGLIAGIITARTFQAPAKGTAIVSAIGSSLGFVVLLGALFLGGTLAGGDAAQVSDTLTTRPLSPGAYGLGVGIAAAGSGYLTQYFLD